MTLEDLAQQREEGHLERYGEPNYHLLDLPAEIKQELADAMNYFMAELLMQWPAATEADWQRKGGSRFMLLADSLGALDHIWKNLQQYEQLPDPPEWAEMLGQGWGKEAGDVDCS